MLRSDRGGEYFMHDFNIFCEEHGIIHQCSAPYTPQQNGLAERKNRTLGEMVNCMLNKSKLPFNLWGEALLTACYIHNRIVSKKTKMSPYEIIKERKPDLSYLKVWGCLAYYRVPDPKRTKLGPRALKGVFIGYTGKAYRILDVNTNTIVESRDVVFFENKFHFNNEIVGEDNSNIPSSSTSEGSNKIIENNDDSHVVEPRRSVRPRKEKSLHPDFISSEFIVCLVEGDQHNNVVNKHKVVLNIDDDPKTYSEAMSSRDCSF